MALTFPEIFVGLLPQSPDRYYIVNTVFTITQEDSRTAYALGTGRIISSNQVRMQLEELSFSDRTNMYGDPFVGGSDLLTLTCFAEGQNRIRADILLVTWSVN